VLKWSEQGAKEEQPQVVNTTELEPATPSPWLLTNAHRQTRAIPRQELPPGRLHLAPLSLFLRSPPCVITEDEAEDEAYAATPDGVHQML